MNEAEEKRYAELLHASLTAIGDQYGVSMEILMEKAKTFETNGAPQFIPNNQRIDQRVCQAVLTAKALAKENGTVAVYGLSKRSADVWLANVAENLKK